MFFYPFNEQGYVCVDQLDAERDNETNRLMYEVQSLARERGPKAWALFLEMQGAGNDQWEALTAKVDEASNVSSEEGFRAYQAHSYARYVLTVAQCEQQLAALSALRWDEP
ncbi:MULTISPECIES: hypothetical protein [unclassified Stenotrophomonas]|uniref:hypothetical protein n=1 Tax=unclassified Stenotrophomonas TaxID=196198 RepID=UPI00177DC3E0|nr:MULTISPECIES: hypothetical protein [unclassified Stenotrophomonas]MBD8636614.1 hypothetical protein [Stenotrophomonas sp. CFBP 13725]MBD8696798.1 hypothetical protein [Stenotrophomonas sp. CFBP 13718]